MSLFSQHDAHVVDRKLQKAADFGHELAKQTICFMEEKRAAIQANVDYLRKVAPEAFVASNVIRPAAFRRPSLRVGIAPGLVPGAPR